MGVPDMLTCRAGLHTFAPHQLDPATARQAQKTRSDALRRILVQRSGKVSKMRLVERTQPLDIICPQGDMLDLHRRGSGFTCCYLRTASTVGTS